MEEGMEEGGEEGSRWGLSIPCVRDNINVLKIDTYLAEY